MITYAKSFQEEVDGKVKAVFSVDPDGNPRFELDDDGTKHYFIQLRLQSPRAEKIDRVTYCLDGSYYSPIRPSTDRDSDFMEEITSFGDYSINVKVQMGRLLYVQDAWLSDILEEGYAREPVNAAIRAAIEEIRSN